MVNAKKHHKNCKLLWIKEYIYQVPFSFYCIRWYVAFNVLLGGIFYLHTHISGISC